jgi:curved DNA-binding protein CbpA
VSEKSLYDILGLSSNASSTEIKAAFRKMAKKFHPDINTSHNAGEFFKLINSAYETLRNEEKKAVYDKIIFNSKQPFKGENKKSSDAQRAAETKARQEQEAAQRAAETKARQGQEAAQRAAETKARQDQEAAQRAAETKARQIGRAHV